ncbi:MAG: hypothetical protein R8K49_05715 [Mariprofundaceae bacterium]
MIASKVTRSHINEQIQTTVSGNHLETRVFDGLYVEGPHALEYGAILTDSTDVYRLYYSFDGVGVDILEQNIHVVLSTTNFGTPFSQFTWLFIGQSVIRQAFCLEAVAEVDRIRISERMMKAYNTPINTFKRHMDKIISGDTALT